MIIEGHLFNDRKRLNNEFPKVHKAIDEFHKTDNFCKLQTHHLEWLLDKYNSNEWSTEELRAGIFHLLDDFGGELPLKEDWSNQEHWLGKYCEDKKDTD